MWHQISHDSLSVVFQSLQTQELRNASLVCRQWTATANDDAVWKQLAHRDYPLQTHGALYASFETLGVAAWKPRYRLLRSRKRVPKPAVGSVRAEMNKSFAFVFVVADESGLSVSAPAELGEEGELIWDCRAREMNRANDNAFSLVSHFPAPAKLDAGVLLPRLDPVEADVDLESRYAFGGVTIDLFVRRIADGKVAHLLTSSHRLSHSKDFDFEEQWITKQADFCFIHSTVFASSGGCTSDVLDEHVHSVYPNLAMSHSGQRPIEWPDPDDRWCFAPRWDAQLTAVTEPPDYLTVPDPVDPKEDRPPFEGGEEDEVGEYWKSGAWKQIRVDLMWKPLRPYDGYTDSVEHDFIAQILTGRALDWA